MLTAFRTNSKILTASIKDYFFIFLFIIATIIQNKEKEWNLWCKLLSMVSIIITVR